MKELKIVLRPITWLSLSETGWGCGYVLVPEGHKAHGQSYWDLAGIDVHGGLTYSKLVTEKIINHFNAENLDKSDIGKWMIGFDTAHLNDNPRDHTKEYVRKEAEKLRKQLNNL